MIEMFEHLKLGESCSLNHFATYTGLKIDEMHLAVEMSMCNTDKYMILDNINQMIEEAKNQPYFIQTAMGRKIVPKEAILKLEDLRRWFIMEYCYDVMDNCDKVIELHLALAEKEKEIKQHKDELKKKQLEWDKEKDKISAEIEAMNKKEEWASCVTYDNVVEQIASNEDAAHRDIATKTLEPLLTKEMARKFRRDIKRKMKEMNSGDGGTNITIENVEGDFNVNKNVKQIGK